MTRPVTKWGVLLVTLLSCLAFYLVNRMAELVSLADGVWTVRLNEALSALPGAVAARPAHLALATAPLLAGLAGAVLVWLAYLYWLTAAHNLMPGQEHGSSKWGGPKDIKPLMNPVADLNIPLSATEAISLPELPDFQANRNKNIVLIGGSGSGKTYGEYYPSLMQLHSSYVVTDPKGTMLGNVGQMLQDAGYRIKVVNTVDLKKSMHYNPLAYIRSEADILKVVNVLMENTKGEGDRCTEDFWVKAERMMYTALIAYLWEEAPVEDRTLPMMAQMLNLCWVREDDEGYVNPVDVLFERLARKKPGCLAVKQYAKFKLAAGKTAKSILVSCGARLSPFDISELAELTAYDELELDELGSRKSALFVIMSDTDTSYSFLVAMLMYQMFNVLCTRADTEYGGKLPVPVRCLFDEFYNCGRIPGFQHLIATMRSRNISCMLGLQSLAQLKAAYKDDADGIIDNCDTTIFLGGKAVQTTKQVSEMIGKATIGTKNATESKGSYGSFSVQDATLGRDLIDPAEIGRLGRTECLVLISGLPPFKSQKSDPARHRRFRETALGGGSRYHAEAALRPKPPDDASYAVVEQFTVAIDDINALAGAAEPSPAAG